MQDYHAEFVEIYNKNITRPGADRLLSWLETTDFSPRRPRPGSTVPVSAALSCTASMCTMR